MTPHDATTEETVTTGLNKVKGQAGALRASGLPPFPCDQSTTWASLMMSRLSRSIHRRTFSVID